MSESVAGKVVIVTGASAGIGRAAAVALAAAGASVVVTARREDRLKELTAEIEAAGGKAISYAGDAREEATAIACIQLAIDTFGRLDIVICNAGAGNYKDLVETSVAEYDDLMDTNMRSTFTFCRHAAPPMMAQRSGLLLIVSSVAGLQGYAGEAVYCATKFAQVGFAQALDGEMRKHGVKVTTLCPGGVKTEFAIGRGRTTEKVAASGMLEAEDVAESILLACTQSAKSRIVQLTVRHMGEPGR